MSARGVTWARVARVRAALLGWLGSLGVVVDAVAVTKSVTKRVSVWWVERVLCSLACRAVSAWTRKPVGALRGWRGWPVLAGWLCRAVWVVWRVAGPPVRDAAGWLRYRAPRVVWRGVCWLARRVPRWTWRATVYALVGAWWVLSRSVRWASGHASYAALVKQMDDDQRHGTAKRLREEWARMAALRSVLVTVVAVVAVLVVTGVADKIGNVPAVTIIVGLFALVGRGRKAPAGTR